MEYIVYIIIGIVVLYFIGSSGKSTSTKRTVTIKDYVQPKTKYSLQESREIIEVFSKDFGFNEIETISEEFQGLLYECKKMYSEEINLIQNDCKDEVKVFEKQIKWFEKESDKLFDDCSPFLKKYLSYLKSNESTPPLYELNLPKELPDSYY